MSLSKNENYRWVDGKSPNFLRCLGVALGCLAVLALIINTSEPMSVVLVHAQESPVVTIETEPLYPPYAKYVEQMVQFPCSAKPGFNEWQQKSDLEIVQRLVSVAVSVHPATVADFGKEKTVCIITIFYKVPVAQEEEEQ